MDTSKPGTELLADLADRITKILTNSTFSEDAANQIAESVALDMANHWGGQLIYFPKGRFVLISKRDREIYTKFDGTNIKSLALEYKVSEQHVYRIIKAMRRSDLADRHGDLFASEPSH